ncbi:hypothetical protein IJT10_04440 [bacterium]|nr:hypothetical protein [bacterium]
MSTSKFFKYLVFGSIFLIFAIVPPLYPIRIGLTEYLQTKKLVKVCTQEITGTVLSVEEYGFGRVGKTYKVTAEYKINDKIYETNGEVGSLTDYFKGQSIIVHFNPDSHNVAYTGKKTYEYWGGLYTAFWGLVMMIPAILILFKAKIGKEKIVIIDASGTTLTVTPSDRSGFFFLINEDGFKSLVIKEQVLDIIINGGKF